MNIFRDAVVSVLGLCMMFACVAAVFAAPEEMSGGIQEMMSPGEFKAAGLNKLSPEELQKLNAWLQGYRDVTEKAATKKATAVASRTKLDLLVSRVDGTFNGLTGRTVIRLEDGRYGNRQTPKIDTVRGLLITLRPWSFTASSATKCKSKGPRNSTSIPSGRGRTPRHFQPIVPASLPP